MRYYFNNTHQKNQLNANNSNLRRNNYILERKNNRIYPNREVNNNNLNMTTYHQTNNNKRTMTLNSSLASKNIMPSYNSQKYRINYEKLKNNLPLTNKSYQTNRIYNDRNNEVKKLYNTNNNYNINSSYETNNNTVNKRQNHNYFESVSSKPKQKTNEIENKRYLSSKENKNKVNFPIKILDNKKVKTPLTHGNHNQNLGQTYFQRHKSFNTPIVTGYKNNLSKTTSKYKDKEENKQKLPNKNNNEVLNKNVTKMSYRQKYSIMKTNDIKINENVTKTDNSKEAKKTDKNEEKELFKVINKEIGIRNLGNTCFINSCLQILIHCPLFIYKLIKNKKLINENTPLTSNFLSICKMMINCEEKAIDISDFKNLLGIKHKLFEGYLQNDSQEFFRILLEDISRELNEIKLSALYRILSNSDKISKKLRDDDFHKNFTQREKSIITELFYAQIVNIFVCECKAEIYSFQKILDFPLLFPEKLENDIITINELLKLYFQTEVIDFESICEKCKNKCKHKKEIKISRPPEILILSLQRINGSNQKKLGYSVKFPQILDIYEYIDHDCGYDKESKYKLFGVINHAGSINSGHYYSYVNLDNKDWFEFNDSIVNNLKNFSESSKSVYALFYIKQKYINSQKFKI